MIYPVGFRRNSRARGPIESMKVNNNNLEFVANINILKEKLNEHETLLMAIKNTINGASSDECNLKIKKIENEINQTNGGF